MKSVVMLGYSVMRLFRRRLSWMLATCLVFQLVGSAAPLIAAAGSALQEACTCPGGAHATTCPMHHGKEATRKDSTNRCAVTNAYPPTDLALLALAGGAGVL